MKSDPNHKDTPSVSFASTKLQDEATGTIEHTSLCANLDAGYGDPILRWLQAGPLLRIYLAALCVLILGLLSPLVSTWENVLSNNSLRLDLQHDLGFWSSCIVMPPMIVIALGSYLRQFPKSIRDLLDNKVIRLSAEDIEAFVQEADEIFGSRLIECLIAGATLAGVVITYLLFTLDDSDTWHHLAGRYYPTYTAYTQYVIVTVYYYLLASLMFRVFAVFWVLRLLFRVQNGSGAPTQAREVLKQLIFGMTRRSVRSPLETYEHVNILPLHPDRCGGLYPLGRLCIKLNIFVFTMGCICVFGVFTNVYARGLDWWAPANQMMLVAYLLGSAGMVFLPLYPAHNAMKRAKERNLLHIYSRFQRVHKKFIAETQSPEAIENPSYEELEHLTRMHKLASSMPVYPFNTKILSTFIASVASPVMVGILVNMAIQPSILINWFKNIADAAG